MSTIAGPETTRSVETRVWLLRSRARMASSIESSGEKSRCPPSVAWTRYPPSPSRQKCATERQSVVEGKRVSVLVDLGGRGHINNIQITSDQTIKTIHSDIAASSLFTTTKHLP